MCGLSGETTFDGSLADTAAVACMVDALVPRGPDGQGSWSAALCGAAARERGLFRDGYVEALLGDPNGELTPLQGNKLWQLGLLELWLQTQGG